MKMYGKLTEENLAILNQGFCVENFDEDGHIAFQSYYFVGAPFTGLWKKKQSNGQKIRQEQNRLLKSRTYATKTPSLLARKIDSGWDFVLAADNNNIDDICFVERECNNLEIINAVKRNMEKVKLARQNYILMRLAQNDRQDDPHETEENYNNHDILQVEADRLNQEQHSNNGNINYIGKFNEFCQRSSVYEYSETVRVTQYNEAPGWFVSLQVIYGHSCLYGEGTSSQKKDAKNIACERLLAQVLTIDNNNQVLNVEANNINQEQHSLEGNIDSASLVILNSSIGTLTFSSKCKDFIAFVKELKQTQIHGDNAHNNGLFDQLLSAKNDIQIFKIFSEIKWHLFIFPDLTLPIRFLSNFENVNLDSEYDLIERFKLLSKPPVLHNDVIKENTKRNSKRRVPNGDTRMVRLHNTNPKIACKLEAINEYNRLQRIYSLQKQQRINNSDKMIAKLELHKFSIPVKITFPQFQDLANQALQIIPSEIRNKVAWVDIIAAIWSLAFNYDYASQWTACRVLYDNFGIQGTTFLTFAALVFKLCKSLGIVGDINNPKLHARMHAIEASPLSIVVTLILTILFKQDPKKSTVNRIVSSFREIPAASSGLEMLLRAAQQTCEYVTRSYDDEFSIDNRMKKLEKQVKHYLSPEGMKEMQTEKNTFCEIYQMKVETLELAKFVRPNTSEGVMLNKISYDVNVLYNRSQVFGETGHGYRKRPVVLHLNGKAGVGKTRLINYISADTISLILQLENPKYTKPEFRKELENEVRNYESNVYFRPVGTKYQQNFKRLKSVIYVCDDANAISPAFLNGETTYPMELIHLNNSHDHVLNVAEVECKKDALFNSRLIIATDNIKTPDLYYLVCPEAYERRIDFSFEVSIKPEYRNVTVRKGKEYHSVNVDHPDIKPDHSNTFVYDFYDEHNIKYTYEEVIEMVEEKLIQVDKHHTQDVELFRNRAIERLTQRELDMNTDLTHQMAEHFGEPAPVPYPRRKKNVNNDCPETHGLLRKLKTKVVRQTRNICNKIKDKTEDATHEVRSVINSNKTIKQQIDGWIITFETALLAFLLRFVSLQTCRRWENRYRRTKTFYSENKNTILATTGLFSVMILGYLYYKSPQKQKKNKPEARREEKKSNGKYDGGQPSKSAPKGKSPPKTPIKAVPINQSSSDKVIITDLSTYLSKPDTHVACQRANSITKALISNSYYIFAEFERGGKKLTYGLRGFFIRDRLFVTNRHLLPKDEKEFKSTKFHLYNLFNEYENIPVNKVSIMTFAHEGDVENLYYDIICIDFHKQNMKSHVDLTQFSGKEGCDNFVSTTEMSDLIGVKIIVCTLSIATEFEQIDHKIHFTGKAKWFFEMQHTKVTNINPEAMQCSSEEDEDLYTFNTLEYPMQSYPGYCGSVIVANDAHYPGKILGIHMAGYACLDKSYGQFISKEMLDSLSNVGLHMSRIHGDYNTIIKADEFAYLRTVPHVIRTPNKTKLRPSILHNKIMKTSKAPALLTKAPNGEHVINIAMRLYLTCNYAISTENESLFTSILHNKFSNLRRIRTLNREESIKGIDGNPYICPINRKSSAGYPLNAETKQQGKHEYLGTDENWILDHPRVEELIEEFKDDVNNNRRPKTVFVATIKDELVKLAKVEIGKSRAFAAAPLPYTIIFREQYLDYFASVMENKVFNYSLVGVNMYSSDVDTIVHMLLEVAPRNSKQFLAGDFTNFGGTLNLNLLWKIYEFIEYRYKRSSKLCEALWNELVDSQQLFGNTVIHVARGQPSGNPATTLINTMYNVGLCFMVLFEAMSEINTIEAYEIQENLIDYYRGIYYGDDNLHSFHRKITNIMDPNLLTTVMRKSGHIYTTDSKDTTHFEYKLISEVTILKRHFAYDKESNSWMAPLEFASIFEPLNWDRVKDGRYDQKELQMQVNARIAIRELSLHTKEIFDEYVPKIINACEDYGLTLEPECYFSQNILRRIVKSSDHLFFFNTKLEVMQSNDYFNEMVKEYNIDNENVEKHGITIELGERHGSSPSKDSQKATCHKFDPTVNMNKWIAQTYEEYKQETNNILTHIENGNFNFAGQGGNGTTIPFQIPAISEKSNVAITLSASADSERSGTVTITSNWFDIAVRFEAQATATQQLFTLPRGVTNAVATIVTTLSSTCRFTFSLNLSPQPPVNAKISEPVWVTQYEEPVSQTTLIPQLHMMRYKDVTSQNPIQKQIVTLDTVMTLERESVPKNIELDIQKLGVMKEKRDHSIKDVLSRMYAIADIELPPGGSTGDTVLNLDILAEFLSQHNVSAKLDGFAFLRTNFIITIVTRTLATTSGGIIASFYPQLTNLASRSNNVLQASQTPNKRISVSGSEGIELKVPFISAFYGKNLITGSGGIGNVVIKLLTPLNINPTSLKVYIQADEDDIEVTYPTFAKGPEARDKLQRELDRIQAELQQLARPNMIRVENVDVLAQNIVRRANPPDVVGKPVLHMMKKQSESKIVAVKWQPAMNHINKDGEDVAHFTTLSKVNDIEINREFGSSIDEMTINHIAKSQQIIGVRRILPSMEPGHVIYARPCSIIDFMAQNGEISMSHQTWLAMMTQKWKATLDFQLILYLTQAHSVTLSLIFNPSDQGEFQEGNVLDYDSLNKAVRTVVEFDGQRNKTNFEIKPAMNTTIKSVPTARLGDVTANALTWTNDCYSEECSYGMFYVVLEVKMKSTNFVAPFIDFTIDFSTKDLCLGDPNEFVPLVPSLHMMKSGWTTETAEVSEIETRSDHFESNNISEAVLDTSKSITIHETLGDNITSIKDLLLTYTPFSPIKTVTNGNAIAMEVYAFRTLSDLATADKFKYHDVIDYFSVGFAYYKGKINVRCGKVTDQQGPFGEINVTSRRNPVANIGSTSGTGLVMFPAPNAAKSGTRVIPLFKEECIPQIDIPYYQSFHMSRITNSNSYNSGNQPKLLIFRPYNTEQIRLSRAVHSDFQFGFLTALPTFQLVSGSIYA